MNRFALLGVLLFSAPVIAAEPADSEWTPAMMMKVKRIGGVYPSPDGKRVAYTVREAVMDESRSEYVTQIHLADADGGNPVQLTRGSGSSDHPQWSPDGKFIAFLSDRSGKTNLWLIPVSGGEAEQLTDVKTGVSSFQWAPGGLVIAYTRLDAERRGRGRGQDQSRRQGGGPENQTESIVSAVPQEGRIGKAANQIDDARRLQRRRRWDGLRLVARWALIVFAHTRTPKVNDWPTSDLSLLDIVTGKIKALAATPAAEVTPKFSPDGSLVAFVRSDSPVTWGGDGTIHVIDPRSGAMRASPPRPIASR